MLDAIAIAGQVIVGRSLGAGEADGLLGLIAVQLATCGWRFRGRRWAIVGAQRAPA